MQIDISKIDREQFLVNEHIIGGETCYLVQPQHIGAVWNKDNLIFRSSLWTSKGEPISLSWKKHFNWDERPDLHPAPKNMEGVELLEKIDGSTLLVSRFNGELIVRTRGTVDATKMANGHEIELFMQKYPVVFGVLPFDKCDYTFVFEWVSPLNTIVIPYSEPDIYLTGCIRHEDYQYSSQDSLDIMAKLMGVKRPRRYQFESIEQMLSEVKDFKGVEGICAYYDNGQVFRKAKGSLYLSLHRFKERATLPNILDLFFEQGKPNEGIFRANITRDFDFECLQLALPFMAQISLAYSIAQSRVAKIQSTIPSLQDIGRRNAALIIQREYSGLDTSVAFSLLSGKQIEDKMWRKLIEEELEKAEKKP